VAAATVDPRGRTADCSYEPQHPLGEGQARLSKTLPRETRPRKSAAWGIKEQLRTLLACGSLADAHERKMPWGTT